MNDPHENATWVYNYDRGGNITSKVKYAYTTGVVGTALETIPYVYGDSNWKDKLTSYNGQTITYDAIGNPTNDGTWTYTWQAGRQLKQMSAEGTSVAFKYDHTGMRVQKVVEQSWYPETTHYTYHGKLLTHMTVDYTDFDEVAHQDKLHFFYDAQSRPAKVEFNGTVYTYLPNLQGDIVGILDSNGSLVVEYTYDAWGKPLNTTGTLADTLGKRNPFRYRGYVFDEEMGLYYLRSRYYNPVQGRFVNADEINIWFIYWRVDNCFTYCNCSPTMYIDDDGARGTKFELGKGWFFRIDPPSGGNGTQRHIHVWKEGGPKYSQNADGSPHDGLTGVPPKWVRQRLENMKRWIWKEQEISLEPTPSPLPTLEPSPRPSPSPSPYPTPAPGPAPIPLPVPDSSASEPSTEEQHQKSQVNAVNWDIVGAIGTIGALIWIGAKIAAIPYTGGLSLVFP